MGACLSSDKGHALNQVDDSVHVMLTHDRKKRKESNAPPAGYKPRATNPALEKVKVETVNGTGENREGEEKTEETASGNE